MSAFTPPRARNSSALCSVLRLRTSRRVIQEAYVKIWKSAGQFPGAPRRLLDGVDARTGRSRGAQEERNLDRGGSERDGNAADRPIRWRGAIRKVEAFANLGRLEADRKDMVLLAYYNGWSREQLAAKFETPVNTVKTWLRRSMMDIRECLGL